MFKILQLLNKNPNEEITVDEFVQSYLLLEEKIRINNTKYEKAQDELTEEISRNQRWILFTKWFNRSIKIIRCSHRSKRFNR